MSRAMLKRPRDAFDTSPASSTPPGQLAKTMKRYHIDSDAFSDASAFYLPSDSPSNPFGRFKPSTRRDLPTPTPVSEHLVLRFRLARQNHNVYRVVAVPANYTFWHLHRLTQFLFGWKDYRKERLPDSKFAYIQRPTRHVFRVQKKIVFHVKAKQVGLFYSGTDVVRVAGDIEDLKPRYNNNIPWEHEERYTLGQLWNKPDSASNLSRGAIYEHDIFSYRKASVHISIYDDADKIKSLHDVEEFNNTPQVVLGSGLPDDDDDDEDFALDLQHFNEPQAFENFIFSQEDASEEQDDECPSIVRLAEDQALAKKRMSGPLPKHFPSDKEPLAVAKETKSLQPKMIPTKFAASPPKREKLLRVSAHVPQLPDSPEIYEVDAGHPTARELSPVKKRSDAAANHLPAPEESAEADAEYDYGPQQVVAPRKRAPFTPRRPVQVESREVGTEIPNVTHKRKPQAHLLKEGHENRIEHHYSDVPSAAHHKRMPLESRLRDPEESAEIGTATPPPVIRKRASFPPLQPDRAENDALRALYAAAARRRIFAAPRLPDPEESREIGDDRPAISLRRDSHRRASMPPLLEMIESHEDSHFVVGAHEPVGPVHHKRCHTPLRRSAEAKGLDNDEDDELDESEAEV